MRIARLVLAAGLIAALATAQQARAQQSSDSHRRSMGNARPDGYERRSLGNQQPQTATDAQANLGATQNHSDATRHRRRSHARHYRAHYPSYYRTRGYYPYYAGRYPFYYGPYRYPGPVFLPTQVLFGPGAVWRSIGVR